MNCSHAGNLQKTKRNFIEKIKFKSKYFCVSCNSIIYIKNNFKEKVLENIK